MKIHEGFAEIADRFDVLMRTACFGTAGVSFPAVWR